MNVRLTDKGRAIIGRLDRDEAARVKAAELFNTAHVRQYRRYEATVREGPVLGPADAANTEDGMRFMRVARYVAPMWAKGMRREQTVLRWIRLNDVDYTDIAAVSAFEHRWNVRDVVDRWLWCALTYALLTGRAWVVARTPTSVAP